jgi:hypothetical protein
MERPDLAFRLQLVFETAMPWIVTWWTDVSPEEWMLVGVNNQEFRRVTNLRDFDSI